MDSAIFSACERYRYLLTRNLRTGCLGLTEDGISSDPSSGAISGAQPDKVATFIMLNPSTADATRNDPTIRKCIGFAQRWQCVTLQVLNLFAVRATHPRDMKSAIDPIGPENLQWFAQLLGHPLSHPLGKEDAHTVVDPTANSLLESTPATHLVICAWGVHGAHMGQDRVIHQWLQEQRISAYALGFTRQGHPRHPLYMPYTTNLVEYGVSPL